MLSLSPTLFLDVQPLLTSIVNAQSSSIVSIRDLAETPDCVVESLQQFSPLPLSEDEELADILTESQEIDERRCGRQTGFI
jgi:hypothetical protein